MGTRARYVEALAQALTDAGETLTGLSEHPVSPIPGTPSIQVLPGDPYLIPAGPNLFAIRLEPMLWAARLGTENAMTIFDRLLPIMTQAAPEADLRWLSSSVRIRNVAGVDYLTATVVLEGETDNP